MRKNFILLVFLSLAAGVYAQVPENIKKPVNSNVPPIRTNPQINPGLITSTKTITITPTTVTNLCPWVKSRGDNNFENGNVVSVSVNIHFVYNQRYGDSVLKVNIALSGEENSGDRSTVKGEWQKMVYKAPAGWRIKKISNDTSSLVTYFSFNTALTEKFTNKYCHVRMYSPANFGYRIPMPTVRDITIDVHSEKTDDFDATESTCDCGFKLVKVEFKPVYITLEKI